VGRNRKIELLKPCEKNSGLKGIKGEGNTHEAAQQCSCFDFNQAKINFPGRNAIPSQIQNGRLGEKS